MKSVIRIIFVALASLFMIYVSVLSLNSTQKLEKKLNVATLVAIPIQTASKEPLVNIDDLPFQDNPDIYQYDDAGSVVTIYVTVRVGDPSNNSNYTWQQVNDFTKYWSNNTRNVVVGKADAIVQFGDENGPVPGEVGFGAVVPNATIQIRGASTTESPQKSYKIELLNNAGRWRGQSTIDLNKHVYDASRMRNKLSFDLIKQIPNMVSLRTQFVHLYVKDETTDPPKKDFADYGLFTQVEQPNKRFLTNHLLDRDAQLYKANFFEFLRYPDQIRMVDDPLFNLNDFSSLLEIKGSNDNTKLIQMLDDLNNYDIPIQKTFEKYFNRDNYFTWLAFNILVGNLDTQSQNFFLYSPKNGTKFYFLPWDYDGAFPLQNRNDIQKFKYAPWENGVSNYWGVVLHRRVLEVEEYRRALDDEITELKVFLTPERIQKMIDSYWPVIDKYSLIMPDIYYWPSSKVEPKRIADLLPGDIQTNYDLYVASLKKPMPFFLHPTTINGDRLSFGWDESYSFDRSDITYHFLVSTDMEFKKIVNEETLQNRTDIQIPMLKPGTYFWKVTATNQAGEVQVPFDDYLDADSNNHYGMKYLFITSDGKVLEQ